MTTARQRIMELNKLAKEARKKKPGMKWTTAMKEAGKQYRKKHGSSKSKKKKSTKKRK